MEDKSAPTKPPIGGWLILVGISIWLTVITLPLDTILVFPLHIHLPISLWLQIVVNIVTWVPSLILLVFFTKRRRAFIPWAIGTQTWIILHDLYYFFFLHIKMDAFFVIEFIFLLYTIRSKRVKRTFIR